MLEPLEARDLLSGLMEGSEVEPLVGPVDLKVSSTLFGIDLEELRAAAAPDEEVAPPAAMGPVIADFQAVLERGRLFTFQGRILGDQVEGLVVQFGGLSSLANRQTVVNWEGWFCLTVRLRPGEEGTATAQIFDQAGQEVSGLAMTLVRQI
jgi:hypothetical protein